MLESWVSDILQTQFHWAYLNNDMKCTSIHSIHISEFKIARTIYIISISKPSQAHVLSHKIVKLAVALKGGRSVSQLRVYHEFLKC